MTEFYVFVKTEISLQSSYDSMFLMLETKYSQTCIQQSPLGQRKNDGTRQMTAYLRSSYAYYCYKKAFIGKKIGGHFAMLRCFCNDLQLIS